MKISISTAVIISVTAIIIILISHDAYTTYSDIKKNREILDHLDETGQIMENGIRETRIKIRKFQTDPRAAEAILRQKFQMLKKDQFIVND